VGEKIAAIVGDGLGVSVTDVGLGTTERVAATIVLTRSGVGVGTSLAAGAQLVSSRAAMARRRLVTCRTGSPSSSSLSGAGGRLGGE
jgi:hypothetical protein